MLGSANERRRLLRGHGEARTARAGAAYYGGLGWGAVTGSAREGGMTTQKPPPSRLPHHTLVAYDLCLELVRLVARIRIGEAQLRQQARKSAASAALNRSLHGLAVRGFKS